MSIDLIGLGLNLIERLIDAWRQHDDDSKTQIAQVLARSTVTLNELAMTESLGTGSRIFELKARGAVAVELATAGIDADHPPLAVAILRDAAVYAARAKYEARATKG